MSTYLIASTFAAIGGFALASLIADFRQGLRHRRMIQHELRKLRR